MSDFTFKDIDIDEGKRTFFPNWLRLKMGSREECIEYIFKYMQERQGLFDRLGLQGPIIKREKKKK